MRLAGEIENRLTPGRYFVHCYAARSREHGDIALHQLRLFDFVVYGPERWKGSVDRRRRRGGDARAMSDAAASSCARFAARRRSAAAWRRAARPAVPDRRSPSSAAATSAPRSATCGRWPVRCCCSASCCSSSRRRSTWASGVTRVSGPPAVQHRAVRLLPGGHRRWPSARSWPRSPVVRKTQFPRARDPARGRAHRAVQPRDEPGRGVRVHPRGGRRPDVDVAAAAGRRRCC